MKINFAVAIALAGSFLVAGCSDSDGVAPKGPTANVRVLHASPDAPAVDVAIDGDVVLTSVEFQQGTGYLEVPAGAREVSILVGGSEVLSETFDVQDGESYSIIAQDVVANLDLVALNDTDRRANGTADVTVVHASPSAGDVDIYITAAGDPLPGTTPLDDVPFGTNATLGNQPAGDYQVRITPAAGTDVVYDSGTLPISSDVTAVAVNSVKGVSPVSLLIWAEANPAVTAVLDNTAEVRVVHGVEDVAVDVFVDGDAVASNFMYTNVSGYLVVPAGDRDVAVAPAGQGVGNALASLSDTLTVERGESYTVIAAGDSNNLSDTQLIVLGDRRSASDDTQADVRLVHAAAAPGAQPVDIFVLPAGQAPVVGDDTFGDVVIGQDTGYTSLPPASYDVTISPDGTTTPAISVPGLSLAAGDVKTAIAIGASDGTLDALLLDDLRP
ncbi:DUF4397 domain-containing protein [Marinobacter halotolerans]|uniref:DUF4397 domain-containing protein n=1 Tax=Marinobacter halotolerans TaxID=1569211 RepID=UPI0012489F82|nr:DUF4397 domain-containing protein [Marinobacter halotolerans]